MNLRNVNINNNIKQRIKEANDNYDKLKNDLRRAKELQIKEIEECEICGYGTRS